jgi:hypothetical protein
MYPFLAALAPIGAGAATRWKNCLGHGNDRSAGSGTAGRGGGGEVPADKSDWIDGYFDVSRAVRRDARRQRRRARDRARRMACVAGERFSIWKAGYAEAVGVAAGRPM